MRTLWQLGIIGLALQLSTFPVWSQESDSVRPNILLIVADDLGYTDLGAFGSTDIQTPVLDNIALNGVRLTRFYSAPSCKPARAMLMSGTGNHEAGIGSQFPYPEHRNEWGYEGQISDRVALLPEVLHAAGYHTYMSGKWHIGDQPGSTLAHDRGFERSFALNTGGEGHYQNILTPLRYSEDGEPLEELPQNFYSTNSYVDKLIDFVSADLGDGRPFFAWFAPTAPHSPLQPHTDWINRYVGQYDSGYDSLCRLRARAARESGVGPEISDRASCNKIATPWSQLSDSDKAIQRRVMELHAAMVEHLDTEVGRLLDFLKQIGQLERTYVLFVNDNGPQGGTVLTSRPGMNNQLINLGYRTSYPNLGQGWADAVSAPFRDTKGYQYEGGIRVPAFIWRAGITRPGSTYDGLLTIMDVMPTVLELTDTPPPNEAFAGRSVLPMRGRSFASLFRGSLADVHYPYEAIALDSGGHSVVFRDAWKLVKEPGRAWQLFNILEDPGETNDLSAVRADVRTGLIQAFEAQSERSNFIEPGEPRSFR